MPPALSQWNIAMRLYIIVFIPIQILRFLHQNVIYAIAFNLSFYYKLLTSFVKHFFPPLRKALRLRSFFEFCIDFL